eukprot:Sspe_Gene.6209::Locus_2093_Transcript_2_2_Confidence_0.444_Length_2435::g.6209::m.6209
MANQQLAPRQQVALQGLTTLSRFNGVHATVLDVNKDGKVRVETPDGLHIKVNLRNCSPLSTSDAGLSETVPQETPERQPPFSPSPRIKTPAEQRSPMASPRSTRNISVASARFNGDLEDFSRLLTEVTAREAAFSGHCSKMQLEYDRRHLEVCAMSQQEVEECRRQNTELRLQVEQLKAKLHHQQEARQEELERVQRKLQEDAVAKKKAIEEQVRARLREEMEVQIEIRLQEERDRLGRQKVKEWKQLQETFNTQLVELTASYEQRFQEEKRTLQHTMQQDMQAATEASGEESRKRLDRIRAEFENLFSQKVRDMDERAEALAAAHEDQLRTLREMLEQEKQRELQEAQTRYQLWQDESRQEIARLQERLHEAEEANALKHDELQSREVDFEAQLRQRSEMVKELEDKWKKSLETLQLELAAARGENATLRVKLQQAESSRASPLTLQQPQNEMHLHETIRERVRAEFQVRFEKEQAKFATALKDQEERYRTELVAQQRAHESRVKSIQSDYESAVHEIEKLQQQLSESQRAMSGRQSTGLRVSSSHAAMRREYEILLEEKSRTIAGLREELERAASSASPRKSQSSVPAQAFTAPPASTPGLPTTPRDRSARPVRKDHTTPSVSSPPLPREPFTPCTPISTSDGFGLSSRLDTILGPFPSSIPSPPPPATSVSHGGVQVFSHINFRGPPLGLPQGKYNTSELRLEGHRVGSIKVPEGWVVTFFEHPSWRGMERVYKADCPILSECNGQESSFTVERLG